MPDPAPEADVGGAVLVPVGESVTLRQTVAHAVEVAVETAAESIHFVVPVAWHDVGDVEVGVHEETRELLERVEAWAREDTGGSLAVETAIVGADEYLFSPDDYARVLAEYADDHDVERIVVDPEYSPGGNVTLLRPMEVNLAEQGYAVEEAPVDTAVRRAPLTRAGGLLQFGLLFGVSFLFYQLLGGFAVVTGDSFDLLYELVTGTVTAAIVAGALQRVTLTRRPRLRRLAGQVVRLGVYTPYLLYEIVKSNLVITYIILHPRLPIDPRLTRVRSAVWGGTPVTTLANSITLTPGTLTVRAEGRDLYVHSLFPSAREGLFDGALERGVRFVFYGRRATAVASPAERGDSEVLQKQNAEPETRSDDDRGARQDAQDQDAQVQDVQDQDAQVQDVHDPDVSRATSGDEDGEDDGEDED